ncbi:MAG: hypothetical protein H7195_04260, partial [Chryseobacterium sp.]|nr:hypothetical protein [Chryseobacterium sp.]
MKIFLYSFILLLIITCAAATKKSKIANIQKFQKDLNTEYQNPKETPLRSDN